MNTMFKEGPTFIDWSNRRVTIHFRFDGKLVIRVIFNFMEGFEDHIDGCLRDYMPMIPREEQKYLQDRRNAAWERLCQVNK